MPDPVRSTPAVPVLTNASFTYITITTEEIRRQLLQVDSKKALGPDNSSPHNLKHCVSQLATHLTTTVHHWPHYWQVAHALVAYKKARELIPRTIDSSSFSLFLGGPGSYHS